MIRRPPVKETQPTAYTARISFIRDYKYVRYVIDDAALVLAPDTAPPGEATADG